MQDMFAGFVAIAPTRALANSAMPDAPVVVDRPRPAGRRLRAAARRGGCAGSPTASHRRELAANEPPAGDHDYDTDAGGNPVRVVADDTTLTREGTVRLLREAGVEVAEDGDSLLREVAIGKPTRSSSTSGHLAATATGDGCRQRP